MTSLSGVTNDSLNKMLQAQVVGVKRGQVILQMNLLLLQKRQHGQQIIVHEKMK